MSQQLATLGQAWLNSEAKQSQVWLGYGWETNGESSVGLEIFGKIGKKSISEDKGRPC